MNVEPDLYQLLVDVGFDFFTGVPDSTLKSAFARLERDGGRSYVPAVAENFAVGLAVGAHLGGRRPAVLMQNSGLGLCHNALASLATLYRIPMLLVIGWRGHDGRDAPEHLLTGRSTLVQLEALELPYCVAERDTLALNVARATAAMRAQGQPSCLVVRPWIGGT